MNYFSIFLLTLFIPGSGHILLKKYWGILIVLGLIMTLLLFPYLLSVIIYIIALVLCLYHIYDLAKLDIGKKKATRALLKALIVYFIIIPIGAYLIIHLLISAGNLSNDGLNNRNTEKEMQEVSEALKHYKEINGNFPNDYTIFVNSKPIWTHWKSDAWENEYSYILIDSTSVQLTSAGKDQIFNTSDDKIILIQ